MIRFSSHAKVDEAELAAVAFLTRYSGRTLEAYRQDLGFFFAWAPVGGPRGASPGGG